MIELKPKRMMAILAHPDDESFGMGGTLAKYSHQDVQIILLCATRGEAGIPGVKPDDAGKIREQELRKAAEQLGIDVFFLDYLDGNLSNTDPDKLLESVTYWISTVAPQVVLTFGPDGVSGHPDHVSVSHIVTKAINDYFPRVWLFYLAPSEATVLGCGVSNSNSNSNEPMVPVDISDFRIDKVRAIQCHASQHPPLKGKPEEEVEKIHCHEYFTLGRKGIADKDSAVWFEDVVERFQTLK